ncbi:L-ascorbate metabolism protein UlaG (beta-lactamase superfamily) [Nocardioides thalensis]|uniref:L-ascorbate metabolism protein UlaG (Beta-lactamase superfamily) n=1 Tax=Nocardioides thalensis TaxID=1914755 RepID=A0A853C5U2_9ACTN|nr:L-ascorbate metabolism protein UlaG (beta-lactamase superfamily) [Nocardioides thalensis]
MNEPAEAPGPGTDTLTFVGTATTVLRLGRFTLLTDPNFLHRGQRAYLGKGLWSRRLTDPALGPSDLPPLDAIVLSHLHGDHFDRVARRELVRDQPVLTTPQAADKLRRWGFDAEGLRDWERTKLTKGEETLFVEAVPGIHARGVLGRMLPPVMGSVLEHRVRGEVRRRVYISGDTLTGEHVSHIAERHPDLDTAVVHLGGTKVLFHTVTMDADQGVDFLRRTRPGQAIPVHYDDYTVFKSQLSTFLERARTAGLRPAISVVERGESVALGPPAS